MKRRITTDRTCFLSLALILATCPPLAAEDALPSSAIHRFGVEKRPSILSGCGNGVYAVAVSPDGNRVATGESGEAVVWGVKSGKRIQRHPNRGTVHTVNFSPDGKQLAWGGFGNSFALVELASAKKVHEPDVGICVGLFTSYSADGKRLLTDGGGSRGHRTDQALLWDVDSGDLIRRFKVDGQVKRGLLTPDGKTVITGDTRGRVRFWEAATGKVLGEVGIDAPSVLDLSMDAAGSTVAAVSSYPIPYVSIIDVARRIEVKRLPRKKVVRAVALSGDGKLVAVAGNERGIEVYDVGTGKLVQKFDGHRGGCSSLAFNADATALLSGGFYGSAILWRIP